MLQQSPRRWVLAVGLFVLAPFVGEFALGNAPITALPVLLWFAPMYGGGALLIREVTRRVGAGWPTMIGLAAAYSLVEEGLVDQMLMNPAYLTTESFGAVIPGLGISAELTTTSLAIHTVWSICVPIAIMEAFDRSEPRPWLGRVGLGVVAAVFGLGCLVLGFLQWDEHRFLATPLQFAVTVVAIAGLVVAALTILRRWSPAECPGSVPRPRTVAWIALGLSTLYWILVIGVPPVAGSWALVACWAVLSVVVAVLLVRGSTRPGWGRPHRLGVAVGTLSSYLWLSFVKSPALGVPLVVAVPGSAVIGACVVVIMVLAVRAERRHRADPQARSSRSDMSRTKR